MNAEALMALARENEENCAKEIQAILTKYSCEVHWRETHIDAQLADRGLFFKFNPQGMLRGNNGG
jgi:hypothetical protein